MKNNKKQRSQLTALMFVSPAFLVFTCFFVIPVMISFYYGFTSWNGYNPVKKFIGLENYVYLFTEDLALFTSLKNNGIMILSYITIGNGIALILAIVFNSKLKGRNIYRGIFFMPVVLSTVAAGYIWSFMYAPHGGLINEVLKGIGLESWQQNWLGNYKIAFYSVIVADLWKSCNFNMILFLAGLQSITPEVYEAASIDGATKWQQFRHITMPLLKPTSYMVTILTIIGCLKSFDMIYVMTGGGPGYSTEVIATRLVNEAFTSHRIGYASAQAFALFIMVLAVSIFQLWLQKRKESRI